jgi:1-deoxy-D-xylulose 5-phosphate reductoisomerase
MSPKVFLIGATGHIGAAVLHTIHNHHSSSNVEISVLVRIQNDAELLQQRYGVTPVIGTLESIEEIAGLIRSSHIIISASIPHTAFRHVTLTRIQIAHQTSPTPLPSQRF